MLTVEEVIYDNRLIDIERARVEYNDMVIGVHIEMAPFIKMVDAEGYINEVGRIVLEIESHWTKSGKDEEIVL